MAVKGYPSPPGPALGSLSDFEIDTYFKGEPRYGGTFSNDQLTKRNYDPKLAYILNLQNLRQSGSHWVALLPEGRYIDSYGVGPTQEITPLVRTYNKSYFQGFKQSDCGYFAIYHVEKALAGEDPFDDLKASDYSHNYDVLKRYFTPE